MEKESGSTSNVPDKSKEVSGQTAGVSGETAGPSIYVSFHKAGDDDDYVGMPRRKVSRNRSPLPNRVTREVPNSVRQRIRALKKLQFEYVTLQTQYIQEVNAIDLKYEKLYAPLYEKRRLIVSGEYEPEGHECNFPLDDEEASAERSKDVEMKEEATLKKTKVEEEPVKGVPKFWLLALRHIKRIDNIIEAHDEPVLEHLMDIKLTLNDAPTMGFKIEFYFEENEYFTDRVLTKEYDVQSFPDEQYPLDFSGVEIIKCRGCNINWKKGKNVTKKIVKKKKTHRNYAARPHHKRVLKKDSFFAFFDPPIVTDPVSLNRYYIEFDFRIAQCLKNKLIPRAVMYYTAEGVNCELEEQSAGETEVGEADANLEEVKESDGEEQSTEDH